jgi:dihydrofolate synthase/folylpolyglutamate synthase
MLKSLIPPCSKVILTRPRIDRALPPETLYSIAREMISDIDIIPDVDEAVIHAIETASPEDAICIAGSLYVVGEAKELFEKNAALLSKNQ